MNKYPRKQNKMSEMSDREGQEKLRINPKVPQSK
jgi:hypothetical protein